MPLKLGINGFFLNLPSSGIGQYTMDLVRGVMNEHEGLSVVLFVKQSVAEEYRDFVSDTPVDIVALKDTRYSNDMLSMVRFESRLRLEVEKYGIQVLHSPYLFPPPKSHHKTKYVVTVHDAIQKVFTKYRGGLLRRAFLSSREKALPRAEAIITVSRCSRDDICKLLNVDSNKIHVIYRGVDEPLWTAVPTEDEMNRVRIKYKLPSKYILYIGGFDFRKNVSSLVKAYAALRHEGMIEEKLVLAGPYAPTRKQLENGVVEDLLRVIDECRIKDDVFFPGFVEQRSLPLVFRGATLFVYPSLYEGFGLPVLQAMTSGTPVVASSVSSIPEIITESALLFDPNKVMSIRDKIEMLVKDENLRRHYAEWERKRASAFQSTALLRQTIQVYYSV